MSNKLSKFRLFGRTRALQFEPIPVEDDDLLRAIENDRSEVWDLNSGIEQAGSLWSDVE